MPTKELLTDTDNRMRQTVDAVMRDLATMRTGRASLAMLDTVRVDYYGTPTALNQVGNLAVPDPTLITLQPWDPTTLPAIEKAIRTSGLDLNPQNAAAYQTAAEAHRWRAEWLRSMRRDPNRDLTAGLRLTSAALELNPALANALITEAALLAVKATRFPGQELLWDKATLAFTNHPEATDTIVRRDYRTGFAPPEVG